MVGFRQSYIRITAVPPGEAPDWVRGEWVGLVLPVSTEYPMGYDGEGCGVITEEKEWTIGQAVEIRDAVDVLSGKSPAAAKWWLDHAAHLFFDGSMLIFPDEVCELTQGPE